MMVQSVSFHLKCKCLFAWQNRFSLQIGVHHCNDRFVVGHITDNHRHSFKPKFLISRKSSVPGDNLISAVNGSCHSRSNCPDFFNTFNHSLHLLVVLHLKRVVFEWVQLTKRNVLHSFKLGVVTLFLRCKQVIKLC